MEAEAKSEIPSERGALGEAAGVPMKTLERGFRFSNLLHSIGQERTSRALVMVDALLEALVAKGVLTHEELEPFFHQAMKEVSAIPIPKVRMTDRGEKYAADQSVPVDCLSLIPLCQARCCTFKILLTRQDVEEGSVRWDIGNPYWLLQGEDGYCVHSDSASRRCSVHLSRPHTCRLYDCRKDPRVWIDFERRVPAPMPECTGNSPVGMAEIELIKAAEARKAGKGPGSV